VINYWPLVFAAPIALAVATVFVLRLSPKAQYWWDYAKLRLPVIVRPAENHPVALHQFLRPDVPLRHHRPGSHQDLGGHRRQPRDRGGPDARGQQINSGESLTEAFRNLGIFPPLVIRMMRVGEATGALDESLINVTYFYNRDVKDAVDKGMAMIGPALTVVLGGMLMLIMWAVLGPVYDILGNLKF